MTVKRALAASALALTAALAGTVSGAAPAQAAVSCTYLGCDGHNPSTNGCAADAVTWASKFPTFGTVELRYSAACHAVWARGTAGDVEGINVSIDLYRSSSDTIPESKTVIISPNKSGYTTMWGISASFPRYLRACGSASGGGSTSCTAKYRF